MMKGVLVVLGLQGHWPVFSAVCPDFQPDKIHFLFGDWSVVDI